MWVQAAGIAAVALGDTFAVWAVAAAVIGAGTAMVYPTLLAAVGDVAHPAWRARSVGVYRLWRDSDFAVGALLVGVIADAASLTTAILGRSRDHRCVRGDRRDPHVRDLGTPRGPAVEVRATQHHLMDPVTQGRSPLTKERLRVDG